MESGKHTQAWATVFHCWLRGGKTKKHMSVQTRCHASAYIGTQTEHFGDWTNNYAKKQLESHGIWSFQNSACMYLVPWLRRETVYPNNWRNQIMLRNILETEQIMLLFFTCPLILYRNFFQCIDNWIGTWKLYVTWKQSATIFG
jgi:hypothetical protein